MCVRVFREPGSPAAEHDPDAPSDHVLSQPEGGGREPDAGSSESDQSLRVESAVPAETAVSLLSVPQLRKLTCSGGCG